MAEILREIPPIPQELQEAAGRGKLIIFVGAGVSRLAGGPSWDQLANSLLKNLAKGKLLSFGDLDQLKNIPARKKISIAMDICRENGFVPPFREILHSHASPEKTHQVYRDLYSIGTAFVTTNYDEWLDVLAETPHPSPDPIIVSPLAHLGRSPTLVANVFFGKEQLTIEKLATRGSVIHLHGSVRDPDTMVLTARQYLDHYRDPFVQTFLDELFQAYTVLFVGYGLEEDEILDHILRKRDGTKEKQHFRLFPRYSYQDRLCAHLAGYSLNHCGVQHVDYCIDDKDHEQLVTVIADWSRKLGPQVKDQLYLEKIKIIDQALGEP